MKKEEAINTSDKTWYLPHHSFFHLQKPGKVWVVFDASAKYKCKSLNNELFTGSDLLNSLVDVLLRFWNHKITLVWDVEVMFYQLRVKPSDRDALWFLWADSPLKTQQKLILTKCWSTYLEQQIHCTVQTLQWRVLLEITKKDAVQYPENQFWSYFILMIYSS